MGASDPTVALDRSNVGAATTWNGWFGSKGATLRTIFVFVVYILLCSIAYASSERFTEQDIRNSIVGKRVFLAVPFGGEFPLNYRTSGELDGSGEALGLGRYMKPRDRGRWWIDADRLCQKFETWYDGQPMCFEIYRIDPKRVQWIRNNGQKGTARIGPPL
ncbi:hypothetical protein MRS76_11720 [Rhizobiaceae bacterium n13]|uniref:Uncharacterized protein n=1 Tax=Ferirhizobium litorale TaxID=2927786 RepID=A0AAE3QHA7_9HYPH|nr:hypothetical protein [Fererhizobium litorale]MDI7862629.1 hypothetical protein [Fererhizobium litorale]MDI7923888.1 hypothetical protein [Fererhizobium litorale]